MTRARKDKGITPVPGKASAPHFQILWALFELLKLGQTRSVMTWKDFETRPEMITVSSPGSDDMIHCKVLNMHRCFHGFRPNGFPESQASRGRSTVFEVEIIHTKPNADGATNDQG